MSDLVLVASEKGTQYLNSTGFEIHGYERKSMFRGEGEERGIHIECNQRKKFWHCCSFCITFPFSNKGIFNVFINLIRKFLLQYSYIIL